MRSIWFAVVAVVAGLGAAPVPAAITPERAIVAAVERRLGGDAAVAVSDVRTEVAPVPGLEALPDSNARIGKPARFVLSVAGVRRGVAVATVRASGSFPRAARAIERDEEIGGDAVDFTSGEMPSVPLRRLLDGADVVGLIARRDIAAGEVLTAAVLRVPPVVKSGDAVAVTVRIGGVEVTGEGIASGSGHEGDVIRIMQSHTTRVLKGRITGPGAVEIIE